MSPKTLRFVCVFIRASYEGIRLKLGAYDGGIPVINILRCFNIIHHFALIGFLRTHLRKNHANKV